ncbi:MAG TPA: CoA pyrophosphatase [Polyangiaceae bacterium]|nr:CoA pyrophosphatase [Polyangiaceae bacterium]
MRGPIELAQVRRALGGAAPRAELERARRAAVAVVLAPSGAPGGALSLLLMRRSEREGDPWSGHMALPGGHAHRADADLLHTARRETLEEVGIDLSDAELLGALDDVSPMRSSEIAVRPFVFALAALREVALSDEVAEALWVPLDSLASGALKRTTDVIVRGATLRVPAHIIEERVVWGMTFHVLERFLSEVADH